MGRRAETRMDKTQIELTEIRCQFEKRSAKKRLGYAAEGTRYGRHSKSASWGGKKAGMSRPFPGYENIT